MATISDKKIPTCLFCVKTAYTAEVLSATDYYPFGMPMPGRNFTAPDLPYRYGFNGQEKDDDIAGAGNHNTAEFWEYDTRLGRRWNMDPKYTAFESQYSVVGNNPNFFKDPLGDFKKKWQARLYNLGHKTSEIGYDNERKEYFVYRNKTKTVSGDGNGVKITFNDKRYQSSYNDMYKDDNGDDWATNMGESIDRSIKQLSFSGVNLSISYSASKNGLSVSDGFSIVLTGEEIGI